MIEAYIFVSTGVGRVSETFEKIKSVEGIEDAHIVTGKYDIILKAEAVDMGSLTNVILQEIGDIESVTDTTTSIIVR